MNMMNRNVTYSTVGDYQLPNLTLNQPQKPLGRYGRMRRMYLMENRPVLYNSMLLTGKLHPHLLEVEQAAENQKQQMMTELLKQNPAPDKAKNQLMWVQHMNSLKAQVEEVILMELIVNYAKTRDAYAAYRKAGYSKKFLEAHREEIELHKAAKAAFDEADLKKLPKVKDLNVEYFELLSQKKAAYPEYRKAKEEMQELVRAQKNVERFFAEEKQTHETEQVR